MDYRCGKFCFSLNHASVTIPTSLAKSEVLVDVLSQELLALKRTYQKDEVGRV